MNAKQKMKAPLTPLPTIRKELNDQLVKGR